MHEQIERKEQLRLWNTELTDKQRKHLKSRYGAFGEALKVFINSRESWIQSDGNVSDAYGGA